jgi:dipeptidyl-peptidase-4
MNGLILLIIVFLAGYTTTYAQPRTSAQSKENKVLTLEQASLGAYGELAPQNLDQLTWIGKSDDYAYVKNDSLYKGFLKGDDKFLIDLTTLNEKMTERISKMTSFPQITWTTENLFWYLHDEMFWEYDLSKNSVTMAKKYLAGGQNIDVSPRYDIAHTRKNSLLVTKTRTNDGYEVAKDENSNIIYGQAVHRYEFGIKKGTFWSPNGKYLAFYRLDQTMVDDYPLTSYSQIPAINNPIKYPMAGRTSHEAAIGILDVDTKKIIYLNTGKPADQYLTNICFDPTEQFVYVAIVDRRQSNMFLRKFSTATGELVATLFDEKNTKYVEPLNAMSFFPKTKTKFLWISRKSGYNHLYIGETDGKTPLEQLTTGNWEVTSLIGIDPLEKFVYFVSTQDSPTEKQIYKVEIKTKIITKVSQEKGTHTGTLSHSGKYLIDHYSSLEVPRRIRIFDLSSGQVAKNLLDAPNPFAGYKMGKSEINKIKATDGTGLFYRLIKPLDFDINKKYPAIVYVYGGPHYQSVRDEWLGGADLYLYYLAQNGYVVFTLDNRGTPNRGVDFEQKTYKKLGELEIEDQIAGVEHLKKMPFIDASRLAVYGWSFGGYLSTALMVKKPGVFKLGVAGAPVIDWRYYEVMYTERYMNTPEANQDGYYKANLNNFAKDLQGRLFIVHGAMDDVVVLQNTMTFVSKCIETQRQIDYFVYPDQGHSFKGASRLHALRKILQYYIDFL